jgi:agmatinase
MPTTQTQEALPPDEALERGLGAGILKLHPTPFLGMAEAVRELESARVVILPFGYEGGVSYGKGAAKAPEAVLKASHHLELYDEVLETEPYEVGIFTAEAPVLPQSGEQVMARLHADLQTLLSLDKFVVVIGGDHSITSGYLRALRERYETFAVIQLDAHADLRDIYNGSPLSHACVMARALELTPHTLQIGIRSMSAQEARRVRDQNLTLYTMQDWRQGRMNLRAALDRLPEAVFLTLDVDVFDWSVIASTGTPEPGGCSWDEAMNLLETIFSAKQIIGIDVVELSHNPKDPNSAFAVAKLIYKMIGLRFHNVLAGRR